MMASKFKILLICLFFLQTQTCKKEETQSIPPCISKKIEELKATDRANPPASLWKYEYKGRTVYFIPQRCCDIPSLLLDADCNVICMPDGGFTGKGDGKCSDFFTERTNGQLVWKDDRTQ